jgi:uncharacterized protein (DUF362 family)
MGLGGGAESPEMEQQVNPVVYADRSALSNETSLSRMLTKCLAAQSSWHNIVPRGGTIVLKPNMVRHFNPDGELASVVTDPRLVRLLAEHAVDVVGPDGSVVIADSPQNDCNMARLLSWEPWAEVVEWTHAHPQIQFLDVRTEWVEMQDGIIVERHALPGDPLGDAWFDLGDCSAFTDSALDPRRFRGSDYDPEATVAAHAARSHQYRVCRTFLDCDLLVVIPKVKTHKKVGLSLAMKNLVGLVADKNCLPHHTTGFPSDGGDEYREGGPRERLRQKTIEVLRPALAQGKLTRLARLGRRTENRFLPEIIERSGNWWGNDTAWRMVVDLVTLLRLEREDRGKPTHFVYDGVIVGQGNGPLAPESVELGMLAMSDDPVAGDLAVCESLGLDATKFPLLHEKLALESWGRVLEDRESYPSLIPGDIRLHDGWADAPLAH